MIHDLIIVTISSVCTAFIMTYRHKHVMQAFIKELEATKRFLTAITTHKTINDHEDK